MTPEQIQAIRDKNMMHHAAIQASLAAIHPVWAEAWGKLIIRRGKRFGLIKRTKPQIGSELGPEAGLLWEAWNWTRGQVSAHRLGVGPAAMSCGGAIMSSFACRRDDKAQAFETAIDAILRELKK